jgi:hypothetical protein
MEDKMTALKSLTFTTVPKPGANPTLDRRAKVIERLEEQKLLLADPTTHEECACPSRDPGVQGTSMLTF